MNCIYQLLEYKKPACFCNLSLAVKNKQKKSVSNENMPRTVIRNKK